MQAVSSQTDLSEFVGLPWADKGRGPQGYDCWGLFALVYRKRLAIELPSFSGAYVTAADRDAAAALIAGHQSPWREIAADAVRPLDGVVMLQGGAPCHVGLVAAPGLVLHMVPEGDSVIEPYTTGKLRRRIDGFFRHEACS